jgi:type IV pilus assembly protein PilZ
MANTPLSSDQIRQMLASKLQESKKDTAATGSSIPGLYAKKIELPTTPPRILDPLNIDIKKDKNVDLAIDSQPTRQLQHPEGSVSTQAGENRPTVLQFAIQDLPNLYVSYIPMLKNGGIFVPTSRRYELNDQLYLLLSLPYSDQKHSLSCQVIWINPIGVSGGASPGVGLMLPDTEEAIALNREIIVLLSRLEKVPPYTHTF